MIGKTLGHYEILEALGQGGMGVVYKARDPRLDRFVAIKVLPPGKTGDLLSKQRFIREARAASALNHPNIVIVHEIGEELGSDFIVMEYIQGRTLDQVVPRKGLRAGEVLRYATQIAAALAAAHEAGITHRDLKPGNIMVTDRGVVLILDPWPPKLREPGPTEDDETRTAALVSEEGSIVGTSRLNMSPEQAEGKPVDARSDIFSFGVVLYEMLTGQRAFAGETFKMSTLSAILREEPKLTSELVPDVPRQLEWILLTACERMPTALAVHCGFACHAGEPARRIRLREAGAACGGRATFSLAAACSCGAGNCCDRGRRMVVVASAGASALTAGVKRLTFDSGRNRSDAIAGWQDDRLCVRSGRGRPRPLGTATRRRLGDPAYPDAGG